MSQEEHVRTMLTSSDVAHLPVHERVGLVIQATDVATAITRIREAEQAGVHQVWMTQSVGMLETLTLFAAVAAHTTRIRLGTSIVPIYPRHPLVMALQAATVEALVVAGDQAQLKKRLREAIARGLDELLLMLVPVADEAREREQLIQVLGSL